MLRLFVGLTAALYSGVAIAGALPTAGLAGADADVARRALQCDDLLVIRQHPVMPSHVYTYHVEGLRPAGACIATGCPKAAVRRADATGRFQRRRDP